MFVDSSVMDYFSREMVLVKIDGKKDTALSRQHSIMAYPTLVMLDTAGNEIDRIVGFMEPPEFLQTVRDYRAGIGTLDDLLSKYPNDPGREEAYTIADKYADRSASEDAKEWYQKVLDGSDALDSLNYGSRKSLAGMARREGDYGTAETIFTQLMQDYQDTEFAMDAEIWRAYIIEQLGDTARAVQAYEAFLEHFPESEDTSFARGRVAGLKGEATE